MSYKEDNEKYYISYAFNDLIKNIEGNADSNSQGIDCMDAYQIKKKSYKLNTLSDVKGSIDLLKTFDNYYHDVLHPQFPISNFKVFQIKNIKTQQKLPSDFQIKNIDPTIFNKSLLKFLTN